MNKKLKQIAASLLSVLMIVCFMPSMAFAAEGDAASAAVVTTSDGSATYDDFTTALKATLAPDGANDATIPASMAITNIPQIIPATKRCFFLFNIVIPPFLIKLVKCSEPLQHTERMYHK